MLFIVSKHTSGLLDN